MRRNLIVFAIFLLVGTGISGPHWYGFAVYTIFYAAILWLPIYGLIVVRRFVRVRWGL